MPTPGGWSWVNLSSAFEYMSVVENADRQCGKTLAGWGKDDTAKCVVMEDLDELNPKYDTLLFLPAPPNL